MTRTAGKWGTRDIPDKTGNTNMVPTVARYYSNTQEAQPEQSKKYKLKIPAVSGLGTTVKRKRRQRGIRRKPNSNEWRPTELKNTLNRQQEC